MGTQPQPTTHGDAAPVEAHDIVRSETDTTFAGVVRRGGFGKLVHFRYLPNARARLIPCANRDTLCSTGVFDLDAGPVCITLPNAGTRFMSMMVADEHHDLFTVCHGACTHTFTRRMLGTRYALVAIRILVDPRDPKDVRQVHLVQDRIRLEQEGGPGSFELADSSPIRIRRRPASA